MDPSFLLVMTIVLCAAFAQRVTGFGFGLVAIPALVLVLDARTAIMLSTIVGTAAAVATLTRLFSFTNRRAVAIAMAGSMVGLPCGVLVLSIASADALQAAVAAIVLVAAFRTRRPAMVSRDDSVFGMMVAGFASGVARLAAGLPGPPIVFYMRTVGHPPLVQRATLSAFFALSGLTGCALLTVAGTMTSKTLALSVAALPMVAIGAWLGERASATISEERFALAVTWMLVASATGALAALVG